MESTASSTEESSATLLSNLGRFAWAVVGSSCLPCLFREDNTKYVPIRLVYAEVHSQFFNKLTLEALNNNWSNVETFFLTKAESDLLNRINKEHCELVFGEDAFNESDIIVKLHDLIQYYDFLSASYNMLLSERTTDSRTYKCGFLRINDDNNSIVPYVIKNNRQYLPIFYFDDETNSLGAEAIILENLDLAYLKFCCKAQGIKDDLIAGDKCYVVSLEQIKLYFAEDTKFDDFWPADALKMLCKSRVDASSNRSRGHAPSTSAAGTQQSTSRAEAKYNHSRSPAAPASTARTHNSMSRVEADSNRLQGPIPPAGIARTQQSAMSNYSRRQAPSVGRAGTQQSTSRVEANSNRSREQTPLAATARTEQSALPVEVTNNHLLGQAPAGITMRAPPPAYQSSVSRGKQNRKDLHPRFSNHQRLDSFAETTNSSSNVLPTHQISSGSSAARTNFVDPTFSRPYPLVQSMRQPNSTQRKNFDPRLQSMITPGKIPTSAFHIIQNKNMHDFSSKDSLSGHLRGSLLPWNET